MQALYRYMPKYGAGGPSRRGSHALADSMGCEARWYLYAYKRLRARGQNRYLTTGTIRHTALAYYYAPKVRDRQIPWFVEYPDMKLALEEDARGKPKEIRDALEMLEAYREYDVGSPVEPLYVEEEFQATIGQLCPGLADEPAEALLCVDKGGRPVMASEGSQLTIALPRLSEEVVTCRPDLIARENGAIDIWDHKTAGGAKDGSGRLPVLNPEYPDYTYFWQAMVNLWIVRQSLPIRSFKLNRIKRDRPFDFDRSGMDIPKDLYAKVPSTIRQAVIQDRQRRRKVAAGARFGDMTPSLMECSTWGACPYAPICYAGDESVRQWRLTTDFFSE